MTSLNKKTEAIAKFLRLAKTEAELASVLSELTTPSEIEKIHERLRIVDCLDEGLSQRATVERSGAAIATVGRGATLMKSPKLTLGKLIKQGKKSSWWQKLIWRA